MSEDDDNVIILDTPTLMPVPVDRVLRQALKGHESGERPLTEVMVIGFDENEELFFAASESDRAYMLWLLENAKAAVMYVEPEVEYEYE